MSPEQIATAGQRGAAPEASRDRSLDVARGIAIACVVVGHALRGLFAAGLVDPSQSVWAVMDRALYLLHLPVFAFATGLLMPRPVERDGRARYLRARLSLLAYLFLLWTLIEGTAEVLTSSVKNVPVTWWQVLSVWRPLGPLWFLPLLMLATVVVVILSPWWGGRLRLLVVSLTVLASVAFWGWEGEFIFTRGLPLVAWFVLGALVTFDRFARWAARSRSWALVGIVLTGGAVWQWAASVPWVTVPTIIDPDRGLVSVLAGVAGVLGALGATLAVSILLGRMAVAGAVLAYLDDSRFRSISPTFSSRLEPAWCLPAWASSIPRSIWPSARPQGSPGRWPWSA
nr:acyltransferase [Tessaracoccus sp. MC1679]